MPRQWRVATKDTCVWLYFIRMTLRKRHRVSNHCWYDSLLDSLIPRIKNTAKVPNTCPCWRWPMDSPHKELLLRNSFPWHDVIILSWIGQLILLPIHRLNMRHQMWLLIHLSLDKIAIVSQTIFSDAFSWMKNFVFRLEGPIDNDPALI